MRVSLPNEGCRGIDGPDGKVYRPARGHSYVDVPDGSFGRAAAKALGVAPSAMFHKAPAESKSCDGCGFEAWQWTKKCPRCGKEF